MTTPINEIPKVFLHGETLESSELNAIILQINTTIRKLNTVETSLNNHEYDVSIPITNIYCRTKKGINAINFFPQSDAKKDELLEEVSNCLTTQGIKYNLNFSTITLSENADLMNGVWTAYPQGVNESLPHEWEVSYKKLPDNSIIYMFGPVLRSNYGYSGADGDGVQYVYKLFDHQLSDIERTNNTPIRPENPNSNGEFIPSGWSDEPLGPTSDYPYEYVATLKRINGSWGNFEIISSWSIYTEDGTNGDFLARVFCRFTPTTLKSAPNTPIGGTYENPQPGSNDNIQWSLTVPSGSEPLWTSTRIFKGTGLATEWDTPAIEADSSELDIEYSSSPERPADNTLRDTPGTPHPSNNIWHDPSEANLDLSAMVWRAERKIKNGQYNGGWVITKIVGQKGSFKSMVFRRFKPTMQQSSPPIPTGGTYDNPLPDGDLWFDGIPSGNSKTNGPVWASTRIFYDDGTQSNWSAPKLQADSEDLDIEFSPLENLPSNPTGEPFSNREASGWYDPSSTNFKSVGPMIWRAERKVHNGQYVGGWTVTRIYGEKGELGYRGDFVSRVFCRSSVQPTTPTGGEYDNPIPTNTDLHGVLIWSDGIPATGPGTIYTSSRKFYGNPDLETELGGTWSTPTIEADSNLLDIEYSTSVIEPSASTLRQTPGTAHPVNTGVNWYDPSLLNLIPIDPTTNKPYPIIWRAERRISGTVYDGDWVITRILGEEGPEGRRGSFKSCVFKRTNEVLSNFNSTGDGATYDSPIPNGSGVFAGWSDGIPAGDEILWMAASKFTGNGDEHSNWTVTQQTDSVDLDIEFSPLENLPSNPTGEPFSNREASGWYDPSSTNFKSVGPMIWRAERKVHNLLYEGNWVITRIQGEKGDDAVLTDTLQQDLEAAGLQILVTPQNIILDLADVLTGSTDDKIDDVVASIVVYDRTGLALPNNKYLIKVTNNGPAVELYANEYKINGVMAPISSVTNYLEISGANLTDAKSVKIKNLPITTTTENGNSTYTYTYNKGYIRVILTVPIGENVTKDIKIDIPWYLNKLGERITKLKGDLETTLMSKTSFSDPNDPIISNYTASILDGADGRLAEYGLIKTKLGGGYEASFDAQYLQNAAKNISKLSKSITGTNLLSDNWTTFSSPVEITASSGVTIERRVTKVSPQIPLSEGIYILSWYSTETSPNNFKVSVGTSASKISGNIPYITNNDITWLYCSIGDLSGGRLSSNSSTGYEGDYYTRTEGSSEVTYVRFYCKIIVNTKLYYSFVISTSTGVNSTYPVIRPQLELCLATNTEQFPTPWTPGPQDFSSEIKLTTDEITFAIAGPNKTLSQFKLTFDGISQTVSDHTGRFSTIESRLDSISLEAGVSEDTLNKAGFYITAGTPADNTTNPPTPAVPSKVRIKAGLFEVFTPEDTLNNVPEKIVFGNDANTDTMVFYGDVKTGGFITNDVYDRRMNEINANGTGNLGGRLIEWDPNPTYGGLYIGPGPEDITYNSLTLFNSGSNNAHYNGDGIRVFPDGTIHFLGDMDGDFHFGKIKILGSDGTLECKYFNMLKDEYFSGESTTRGISTHINKDSGMYIKLQTKDNDYTIPTSTGTYTSNVDWGSIGFGTDNVLGGDIIGNSQNGGNNFNEPDFGIYVKGKDGRVYRGFTGYVDIGNNNRLYFINGIMIGTSTTEGLKAIFGSNS